MHGLASETTRRAIQCKGLPAQVIFGRTYFASDYRAQHTCSSSALALLPRLTALLADASDSAAKGDAARMGSSAASRSLPACPGAPPPLVPTTCLACPAPQYVVGRAQALSHGSAASWANALLRPRSGLYRSDVNVVTSPGIAATKGLCLDVVAQPWWIGCDMQEAGRSSALQ